MREHNRKEASQSGYELRLNMFADLTLNEIRSRYTGFRPGRRKANATKILKSHEDFQVLRLPSDNEDQLKAILKIADYIG